MSLYLFSCLRFQVSHQIVQSMSHIAAARSGLSLALCSVAGHTAFISKSFLLDIHSAIDTLLIP